LKNTRWAVVKKVPKSWDYSPEKVKRKVKKKNKKKKKVLIARSDGKWQKVDKILKRSGFIVVNNI
jgi:DTW domain-containing protein YfiP